MTTLRVGTVSDAAGTGPAVLTGQVAAKAAAYYDQAGLTSDGVVNISSFDDNSAGLWDINFTNAFDAATYNVTAATMSNNGANVDSCGGLTTGRLSSASPMESHNATTLTDRENGVAIFGDLA